MQNIYKLNAKIGNYSRRRAQLGLVCLKYLDESGCYCTSPTDYTYGRRGEQKRIRQNRRRGRRINIFGIWEPKSSFDYALMLGTLKAPTYVQLMDWQAEFAAHRLLETGLFYRNYS